MNALAVNTSQLPALKRSIEIATPSSAGNSKARRFSDLPSWKRDIELMFHKSNVPEILNFERKIRDEAESKKEELRMLVGNRYRELLEAADTIMAMPHECETLSTVMHNFIDDFNSQSLADHSRIVKTKIAGDKDQKEPDDAELYASLRILEDSAFAIECCLKENQLLRASLIYIIAVEIGKMLSKTSTLLSQVELSSKIDFFGSLKQEVINCCIYFFQDYPDNDSVLPDVLCAYALLKDCSLATLFRDFLNIRLKALESIGTAQSMNMFENFCDIYCRTWIDITRLFVVSQGNGLKLSPISEKVSLLADGKWNVFSNDDDVKRFKLSSIFKPYVPDIDILEPHMKLNLTSFTARLKSHMSPSESASIPGLIQNWHIESSDTIKKYCRPFLSSLSSSKDLRIIRGYIVDRANYFHQLKGAPWTNVENILNNKMDIWNDLFREMFTSRIHGLIEESWSGLVIIVLELLETTLQENRNSSSESQSDYDIERYIWHKFDIKQLQCKGKTDIETPVMTHLVATCKSYFSDIQKNLEDLGGWDSVESQFKSNLLDQNRQSAKTALKKLSSSLKQEIEKKLIAGAHASILEERLISEILIIARLSKFFIAELPVVRLAAADNTANHEKDWKLISSGFLEVVNASYTAWIANAQKIFENDLKCYFCNDNSWKTYESIVNAAEKSVYSGCPWEFYQIGETKIMLPSNPSNELNGAIHKICTEIGKCGGYSFEKAFTHKLQSGLQAVFINELQQYYNNQRSNLTRASGLQIYFDCIYIKFLLCFPSNTNDFDHVISQLKKNLTTEEVSVIEIRAKKAFERTSNLFYFVSVSEGARKLPSYTREQQEKATAFELHNILPVTAPPPRISTLNISASDNEQKNYGLQSRKRIQHSDESKYHILISSDVVASELPARKGLARENSFRSLASEVASPALATISSRLGNLFQ